MQLGNDPLHFGLPRFVKVTLYNSFWMTLLNPILLVSLLLFSLQSMAETARIAVASNFTKTIEVLGEAFEAQSAHRLKFSFGPTGKLYAQIRHGAPYDAFFAADEDRPLRLLKTGGGVKNSQFIYAKGQLALFSFGLPVAEQPLKILAQARFRYLALANPKTAPYGASAKRFLQNKKMYHSLKAKLVRGESVGNAFQYVATRNAEIGFVALSQIVDPESPLFKRGQYWRVPATDYPPINQMAVITQRGKNNAAVKAFWQFMKSDAARAILNQFGYLVPNQGAFKLEAVEK